MKKILYFLITILIGFSSCTISKRQHQPGFYFSWNHFSSPTKEISSRPTIPFTSNLKSEISTRVLEEEQVVTTNDTLPPPSPMETQITSDPVKKPEISKEEMMKVKAKQIQTIHHIKQLVTVGGLFGVAFGSFYFFSTSSVMFPFIGMMMLVALFAGITALFAFIITIQVKNFKKKYPEFSESHEYKKALKARKQARLSLYISYSLFVISLTLAFFAFLVEAFSY